MWSVGGVQTNNVEQQGENFILDCTSNHLTAFAAVVDISAVRNTKYKYYNSITLLHLQHDSSVLYYSYFTKTYLAIHSTIS